MSRQALHKRAMIKSMARAFFQLLVIDDDPLIIESLKLILPAHWQMIAMPYLPTSSLQGYHAAFVDMHLSAKSSEAQGPQIIETLSQQSPKLQIVAISGDLSMSLMEKCLKNGATKFLGKPLSADEVIATLEKIEALWQIRETETRSLQKGQRWMGSSAASEDIKRKIASLRGEQGPILIEGETGTGKEVAFRLLNQQEPNRPAIAVNVAAIPENLFESEMFGHVRGAFTGAESLKVGLTEAAHGGDLFLDEIEAMPLSQQVKLLRFLETGEVRKVGAKETTHVKVRVIAASNQNLSQLVKEGKFREDLLFRLKGKSLVLPPLRERKEDIDDLAKYFLSLERPRTNKVFSPEALAALKNYNWPGNIRELRRICEQLALTSPLPILRPEDVEPLIQLQNIPFSNNSLDLSLGLSKLVEQFEAHVIKKTLASGVDIDRAAQVLQISKSNLYKKIKDYAL